MQYTKATHQTGERYKYGIAGQEAYFVVPDIEIDCPDCLRPVKISRSGLTLQEHRIPNTTFRCDASGARMKFIKGTWVLVKQEDAKIEEVEEEAVSVVGSHGRNAARSPQAI